MIKPMPGFAVIELAGDLTGEAKTKSGILLGETEQPANNQGVLLQYSVTNSQYEEHLNQVLDDAIGKTVVLRSFAGQMFMDDKKLYLVAPIGEIQAIKS